MAAKKDDAAVHIPSPPLAHGRGGTATASGTPSAATQSANQVYGYGTPLPPQGLSIASMVCGIAGILFGIYPSIAAIIVGHIAQRQQPHARAFWLTGLITGYVGIGLWALFIAAYVIFLVVLFTFLSTQGVGQ